MRMETQQTTMGAAMRRAGVDDAPARLMALATQCLRDCGSLAAACHQMVFKASGDPDLVRAALSIYVRSVADSMAGKDLRGGGRNHDADRGQGNIAASTQPQERSDGREADATVGGQQRGATDRSPPADDDGQSKRADTGQDCSATSSASTQGTAGQAGRAAIGQVPSAAPSPVPNPPRGADVIGNIQTKVGRSIFDRIKLADGTPWSAVAYRELFGLARDGGIADAILKEVPQPRDDGMKVQMLISETRFAQIVATAGGRAS